MDKKKMTPEVARYAKILRERRKELRFTQEDVALSAGIVYQQYQCFEYGSRNIRRSSVDLVLRICAVLELDPYELIFANDKDWVRYNEWLE